MRVFTATIILALSAGCSVTPTADYNNAPGPRVVERSLVTEEAIQQPDDSQQDEQNRNRYENPALRAIPRSDAQ